MAFAVKLFKDILADMMSYLVANQSKLTDFNEGSAIRTFLEANAKEFEQAYIRARVGFGRELVELPFYAFNFTKQAAQAAAGEVVFSRTGTADTINIPIGTIVSTTDGTQFATTEAATISAGNTSSAATSILAVVAGRTGNVPANTITIIVTPISGVDAVDNSASTTGGQDEETDAEFLSRFQEFIAGLGKANVEGLVATAKGVTGVRSASVIEHFPPSSSYNATVYIDDGAGNASAELVSEVTAALVGDGTAASPGSKAAGVHLQVLAPTKVAVAVNVTVTDDGTVFQTTISYQIKQAIMNYVNNLEIGQSVIRNKLIDVIMSVTGISDIILTTPSGNTTIGAGQIARIADYAITIAYV